MKLLNTILYASLVLLYSCGKKPQQEVADVPAISDSVISHLTTAKVTSDNSPVEIKLNGIVAPDETRQVKVYSLVSGKIKSVSVELGDYVQKGKVLAVLQSSEVAGAANDQSLAESNVAMARKNMESTKDLFKSNLVTEREYTSSQLEYNKALSELNRAKQVSEITGGKGSLYNVVAPINGYVIEKLITNNSQFRSDNGSNLFTIADLSSVWIIADVYESDIPNIQIGNEVKVNTLADPSKDYTGKIDKIYSVLDPATRTMKVRISMNNPGLGLKPQMFATVIVKTKPSSTLLSIPSAAVVMENSRYYVILKKGKQLSVKEINLIKRIGDRTYFTGLDENDEVVTSSEVFLFQALNVQ
jgi:cobalt-zinc-cadmium efflux system membrane fusion protein